MGRRGQALALRAEGETKTSGFSHRELRFGLLCVGAVLAALLVRMFGLSEILLFVLSG